jgi:uncharacterized protein involved in outer membrane biogenesis
MMSKLLKILAGIIVLLIVAMGIFIATFDVNQYKGEIIKVVEEQTGRDFEVAGDLTLGVSLIPTIKVEGVKLGNAAWGSAPKMITVKSFEMQVGLIPLLSGNIKISQLMLDTAEILLETNKEGAGNWEFKSAAEKPEAAKPEDGPAKIDISEINIKNSSLTYKDGKAGKTTSVKIDNFVVEGSAFSQSLDILLAAVYNNIPISVDGSIGSLASLTDNKNFPVDVTAKIGDAVARIKGAVDKPRTFEGADIQVDFNAVSLQPFATLTGKKLPDIGAVTLTGHIAEAKGNYLLEAVNAQLLDSKLSVDGQVSASKPAEEFDLNIRVETATLANFNRIKDILKTEFPDMGPLLLTGHIAGKENFYHLDAVNAALDKDTVALDGKLSAAKPLEGFDLEIKLNAQNLAKYNALTGRNLPDTGPLHVTGHVSEKDGVYLFKNVTAELPKSKLIVDGKLTDVKKTDGSNLNISFQSTSLADLNGIAGTNLPALGPVSLIASVSDQKGSYHLKDMKFKADKTDLSGDMTINVKGERPSVNATLSSALIDLVPFQGEKQEEKKSARVFSPDPLPLESLKAVDANLDVTAKKIRTRDNDMDNVKLVMSLNNGKLSLKPFKTDMAGGNVAVNMDMDASNVKTAKVNTKIDIKNFQPSSLPDYKDKITGAKTDITIDVNGAGNSVAAIMAGLNGKLLAQIGPGTLKSSATSTATSDVFTAAYNAITPGGTATSGATEIRCGVINLNIKDGMATADKGIAFDTNKMNIIGSGVINLKTEELDIAIDPQAREGIGISAGQLAELVKIGGTLAEPKAVPSTEAALKTAASVGAAVATGGLSILAQGLFDKSTADQDPCSTALGVKPKSTTTTSTTITKTEEEKPASVTEKATDTIKDAGGAIKDTFKGLFGD